MKPAFALAAAAAVAIAGCSRTNTSPRAPETSPHVVVVVWDGMRPDQISDEQTPVLAQLRRDGVFFAAHHSVYPTATQVNGVAIATGVYPARSGLLANREYRPRIASDQFVDTAERPVVEKGDALDGGRYLLAPTMAERLRAGGKQVAIAGCKSIAVLQDRTNTWTTALNPAGLTVFAAAPMSAELAAGMSREKGAPLVSPEATAAQRNEYASRAMVDYLWRNGVPPLSLLWLSEPDLSCHEFAPGSPEAIAAIRSSDACLGIVLQALEERGARNATDVLVVSDHGFSTIDAAVDIPALLRAEGFDVTSKVKPAAGQITVVPNGGTALFYVEGGKSQVVEQLVTFLQRSEFAGVLFTKNNHPGTFPLDAAFLRTAEPPDVVMSMRWNDNVNRFGVRGQITADAARSIGKGTHATLGPADVQNTLVAAGPGFRRGFVSHTPSGNIDLAPTILARLGVSTHADFDGRVLSEAFLGASVTPSVRTETVTAERHLNDRTWQQYLTLTRVGGTVYLDEGNGSSAPP